jgi:hypothetical protein
MPEKNEKPSFQNLWERIAERARRGKNVTLTPSTAMYVAYALAVAHKANSAERFSFTVEQWDKDDVRIEEVMAQCRNSDIARAAYEVAVRLRPKSRLCLRNGAHVLEQHVPEA